MDESPEEVEVCGDERERSRRMYSRGSVRRRSSSCSREMVSRDDGKRMKGVQTSESDVGDNDALCEVGDCVFSAEEVFVVA